MNVEYSGRPQEKHDPIKEKHIAYLLDLRKKQQPQEMDFFDIVGGGNIESDLKFVAKLKERFRLDADHLTPEQRERMVLAEKRAKALEVILMEGAAGYDWLGPNAHVSLTTEYDDIANGVDLVTEFVINKNKEGDTEQHSEYIALAVDASTGADDYILRNKIERNIRKILGEDRHFAEVKYFQSDATREKKNLKTILPVVVGLGGENADNLIENFYKLLSFKENKDSRFGVEKERISNCPEQMIFLNEIAVQLSAYGILLKDKDDERSVEYKRQIESLISIIGEVIESKKATTKSLQTNSSILFDEVFMKIKEIIKERLSVSDNQ